ncbi:MAG: hypothetical protein WCW17_03245 [Patescibacteria group bacterium]|jgi:protein-S-isoprenylcysteine O-methyltransferase Ste14
MAKSIYFSRILKKLNPTVKDKLIAFTSGIILYFIALYFYSHNNYYQSFINRNDFDLSKVPNNFVIFFDNFFALVGRNTEAILCRLFYGYLILGFILLFRKNKINLNESRPYVFLKSIFKFLKNNAKFILGKNVLQFKNNFSDYEKINARYFLLKLFFLPIMINFFFDNFSGIFIHLDDYSHSNNNLDLLYKNGYLLILSSLLLIDTIYFVFGYAFEFQKYSKIRSVEPTILGWVVALACYPPFNDLTSKFFGWGSADYSYFGSTSTTLFFLLINILLFVIYVYSTIALGLKSSNLTNRGIVSRGPYKYVRHPAYISKNLSWIIFAVPLMNFSWSAYEMKIFFFGPIIHFHFISLNWAPLIAVITWAIIYFLRALTEERHLLKDPDYQKYCKKVPYRFIPKVY